MKFLWLGAAVAVLLATTVVGTRPPAPAEATPDSLLILSPSVCTALAGATLVFACANMSTPENLDRFGDCDPAIDGLGLCAVKRGDGDGVLEPSDFAGFDLDGNQAHDIDGKLFVFAFVNDDAPVLFDTERGKWAASLSRTQICGSDADVIANNADIFDEDCDGDGVEGDGLIVAQWFAGGPPAIERGANIVRVQQENVVLEATLTIVGEPRKVTLATIETTIQAGIEDLNDDGDFVEPDECRLPGGTAGFLDALGRPQKTIMISRVTDSDGTNITGGFIEFKTTDPDTAIVASSLSVSLDLGSFGFGAPNVVCGRDNPGTAHFEGCLITTVVPLAVDPNAFTDCGKMEIEVVGEPANIAFAATPAMIGCDGVASSTVTATVTDSDGNLVMDGNEVKFNVQVLGTANPITAKTLAGVATTTITPLAANVSGVPVLASVGSKTITKHEPETVNNNVDDDGDGTIDDHNVPASDFLHPSEATDVEVANTDYIEGSTLVKCSTGGSAPTGGAAPASGGGAPAGTIAGPDTGSGGELAGGGALSAWPAVALFIAAMGLVGARYGVRRMP